MLKPYLELQQQTLEQLGQERGDARERGLVLHRHRVVDERPDSRGREVGGERLPRPGEVAGETASSGGQVAAQPHEPSRRRQHAQRA